MKWLILLVMLTGCAANRALVRDCKDAGPELQNCEVVKTL